MASLDHGEFLDFYLQLIIKARVGDQKKNIDSTTTRFCDFLSR